MIKTYSVTLREEIVERAKKINKDSSRKLSPVLDKLLENWVLREEKKNEP